MESDEERSSNSNSSSSSSGNSANRCNRVREHDMDQMRSSASSPSTISTASSGSPLVRGHSKGSTSGGSGGGGVKRPAPTSIAAAQLQCQQQRMNLKTSSSNHHQQHHHHHHPMKSATSSSLNGGSSGSGNGNGNYANGIVKPEKQPKQQHEENKSFGYNVAKSIAYRAYRFNEFWTLDKMSYLNLACLLMTLVCLITIVLFSTSTSSGNNNNNTGNHQQHHHHNQLQAPSSHHLRSQARSGQSSNSNLSARKFQSSDQDEELESVPEPSSQSLAAAAGTGTTNSRDDSLFDDYAFGNGEIRSKLGGGSSSSSSTMATDYPDDDPAWPPRKSSSSSDKGSVAKLRRKSGPEREIEDFPSSINESQSKMTGSGNQEQTSNLTKEQQDEQQTASSPTGSSSSSSASGLILEPILSQIFKDLELGSLFKAALNGTSGNGGIGGSRKPIIRRSKNGATIIISSSFNESSLANNNNNQSNFIPSLLQKLLPPMLFKQQPPHHSTGPGNNNNNNNNNRQTSQFQFGGDNLAGSATITISGRAIELPPPSFMGSPLSSAAGPSGLQESPFSLPTSLFPSFMSPAASSFPPPSSHSFRSFFPEPMAIRMNSLVSSPSQFAAVPYPSALGMMLRSMAADAEEEASSSSSSSSSPSSNKQNINNKMFQSRLSNTNETLNTQASQQQQTTANVSTIATTSNNNKTENATATATTATSNDPEVETFDVSQLMPFKLPLPPIHRSRISLISPSPNHQSVMIFGSSANPENPFMSGGGGSPFNSFSGGLPLIPPMPIMPHMMMMASGTGSDSGPLVTPGSPSTWSTMSNGPFPMPFNPILRALLGNLASGSPDSSTSDKNNKTSNTNESSIDRYDRDLSGATATMRVLRPIFAPIDMMDSLSPLSSSSQAVTSASSEEPEAGNENLRQQMRARHRSAADMMLDEMDLPDNNGSGGGNQAQASSDFGNLQEQQQQQQPFEQSSSSGIIRQTIRGPGMTVERIIEVPSPSNNQVQQVPRGVRSQSISRMIAEDLGENNGNSGHDESNKPPASTSVNRRNQQQQQQPTAATIERRDDGQFMEEPMGMIGPNRMNFIGKLLSDLSRRATSPRFLSLNRSDLDLDREMIDDSAEAKPEPSGLSPNSVWGPKVRVASARIRLRPSATSPEALFLSPINSQLSQQQQQHQSMQPNGGDQEMSLFQEPLNSGEQQGKQLSLEDTLNSMEDRLDKVLSMASQYTSTPTAAAAAGGNQFHHRAIITPVEKPTKADQQKLPSSIDNQSIGQAPENPYTSPTSPLFGFPASSASSSMMPAPTATAAGDSQQALSNENNSSDKKTKSREPRSFTYHSNNELASDIKQKLQRMELEQQQQAEMRAESIGRASKFGPFLAPPAGAMGRRLDDGPFGDSFSSSSSSSEEQQQQQQEPTAAVDHPTNPIGVTNFLEGRAMMPATGSHQKRPEVAPTNNEAPHFRTIIV